MNIGASEALLRDAFQCFVVLQVPSDYSLCFCAQINDSLDSDDTPKLSLVHFKTLAENQLSSVYVLPYHCIPPAD